MSSVNPVEPAEAPLTLDSLDHKIIAVLQENARLSNADVAAQVGSSEPTVRRRVDRLLERQVIKIVAVAPTFPLGYQVVTEVWFQNNAELLAFLHGRLSKIPGIQRIESLQVVKMIKYAYDWGVQPSV